MKKIKEILFQLLFPPIVLAVLLVPIATGMLIYSFACDKVTPAVQYLSYFLSAYSLAVVCARISSLFRWIKGIRQKNKYINLYFNNTALRIKISLYGSFTINIIYAIMQLSLGFYNRSIWFYALSGYYFLLAIIRFFLLKEARKERMAQQLYFEYLNYRLCGIALLFINVVLSVIVLYIVRQNRGFSYHYIMTIAMAAYTFFTFTAAIIHLIQYRKYHSPVVSASKIINLAAAFVSMLSLETAMMNAFGEENSRSFRRTITACTGAVVCMAILSMAVYMITYSTKQLHQIKKETMENE